MSNDPGLDVALNRVSTASASAAPLHMPHGLGHFGSANVVCARAQAPISQQLSQARRPFGPVPRTHGRSTTGAHTRTRVCKFPDVRPEQAWTCSGCARSPPRPRGHHEHRQVRRMPAGGNAHASRSVGRPPTRTAPREARVPAADDDPTAGMRGSGVEGGGRGGAAPASSPPRLSRRSSGCPRTRRSRSLTTAAPPVPL